jgi:alkylation response protein AidB-like acyl-CoA dehydrogenase
MALALNRTANNPVHCPPHPTPLAIATNLVQSLRQQVQARDQIAGIPHDEARLLRDSGLLPLIVPQALGGIGAPWTDAVAIVHTLATADSSAAQIYGYHLLLSALPHLVGTAEQADRYYRDTAAEHHLWANAINTRDLRLTLEGDGDGFRANGVKTFCTGAVVADRMVCAATQPGNPLPALFVLPRDRPGLTYNQDWDALGQRRTASGSFTFDQVKVFPDEILGPPPNLESAFPTVLGIIGMLVQTAIFTGIAEGALTTALDYTRTQTRPWDTAPVDKATDDPYRLWRYGDLWAQLQGAQAALTQAAEAFQRGWDQGVALSHDERAALSTHAAAAKTLAIQTGLTVTSQMFDLMGARATARQYGFDLYWRNLRTLSLHDPVDYKRFDIGNWVVNGTAPQPSSYA